ncbi:hypothetical protein [Gordonia bronchialis]|uniref:hypothetical protein n=1 Tax=Gordonia bronchialis TaxID=2054 RepID=UPI0024329760|nr:hypothetical protein [Gordonia bronchialis]
MVTRRPPYPMIQPGTPILVRPSNRVHVGTDPACSLIIDVDDPVSASGVADLLRSMQQPCRPEDLVLRARAAGLSTADLDAILHELIDAGKAVTTEPRNTSPLRVRIHGQGPLADLIGALLSDTGIATRHTTRRPATGAIESWDANLVVLTDFLVHDPSVVSTLNRLRLPHLQVRVRDGIGIVGPLVLPGMSSCLRCADHHRTTLDPDWPLLAAQLVRRPGYGSSATIRATAALAHAQIEQLASALLAAGHESSSHPRPRLLDHVLEFRPGTGRLETTYWPPHPLCECRPTTEHEDPSYIVDAERML